MSHAWAARESSALVQEQTPVLRPCSRGLEYAHPRDPSPLGFVGIVHERIGVSKHMRRQIWRQLVKWYAMFRVAAKDLWRLIQKRRRRYWRKPEAGVHLVHLLVFCCLCCIAIGRSLRSQSGSYWDLMMSIGCSCERRGESGRWSGTKLPTGWGFGVPLTINSPLSCTYYRCAPIAVTVTRVSAPATDALSISVTN